MKVSSIIVPLVILCVLNLSSAQAQQNFDALSVEIKQALDYIKQQMGGSQQGAAPQNAAPMSEAQVEMVEEVQGILGELRSTLAEAATEIMPPKEPAPWDKPQDQIAAETLAKLSAEVSTTLEELKKTLAEVKRTLQEVKDERQLFKQEKVQEQQNSALLSNDKYKDQSIIKAYYNYYPQNGTYNPYLAEQQAEIYSDMIERQQEMMEQAYEAAAARAMYERMTRTGSLLAVAPTAEQLEAQADLAEERREAKLERQEAAYGRTAEAQEAAAEAREAAAEAQAQGTAAAASLLTQAYPANYEIAKEMAEQKMEIAQDMAEAKLEMAEAAAEAKYLQEQLQQQKQQQQQYASQQQQVQLQKTHVLPISSFKFAVLLFIVCLVSFYFYKRRVNRYEKKQLFFETIRERYAQINV